MADRPAFFAERHFPSPHSRPIAHYGIWHAYVTGMNTSEKEWEKSTYVSRTHVVQKSHGLRRPEKRLTGILRAAKVKFKPEPVQIGINQDKIKVNPVIKDGQIKALHVVCSCGCESTFDIQYAAGGVV